MKFTVQKGAENARLGIINGIERLTDVHLETPNFLYYTKGGTVPHLTVDVFQKFAYKNAVLNFPLNTVTHFQERMKKFRGSIAEFTGLPGSVTYISLVDPGVKRISGYHIKNHVPVWSKTLKQNINCENYLSLIEALEPDMFQILCDSDTDLHSTNKRTVKSLERSLQFLNDCLEIYKNSEKLKRSKIIGSLIGGYSKEAREKCSLAVAAAPVFGVSIDGLHDCSDKVTSIKIDIVKPMIETSLKHIPPDIIRLCPGSWNPNTVLNLISLGIDLFDTSYPCQLAENGGAFTFINDNKIFKPIDDTTYNIDGDKVKVNGETQLTELNEEPLKKRFKNDPYLPLYVALNEKVYFDNFEPISSYCNCITCKNYTKAYIHHLLNAKEMLGSTLLVIHNLHHYNQFFCTIRKALKEDTFEIMKENFYNLYGNCCDT